MPRPTLQGFVKLFRFRAVNADNAVKAGVSTKPLDGGLITIELRAPVPSTWDTAAPMPQPTATG
ncbi:MAG: hypothetical protein KF774_21905 [Planctomyces sp.]|nr:hypothetical protein [Planctomyces sp.]